MRHNAKREAVKTYLCPGCTGGCDEEDTGRVDDTAASWFGCKKHSAGTCLMGAGWFALGMPKGFNKTGPKDRDTASGEIHLYPPGETPHWDYLNIPVWAMRHEGNVYVRTFMPRLNTGVVEVLLECGTLPEGALDVAEFIDEID